LARKGLTKKKKKQNKMSALGDDAHDAAAETEFPLFIISGVSGDRRVIVRRTSGGYTKGLIANLKSSRTFVMAGDPQTMIADIIVDQDVSTRAMSKTMPMFHFKGDKRTLIHGAEVGAADFNDMWTVVEGGGHHSYAEVMGE
jgi:hypothetical protein